MQESSFKYKFDSQEFQEEFGLNTTAMDFRQYDSAVGRFMCIDALAETALSLTPNNFTGNDPVSFNDPSGLRRFSYLNSSNADTKNMLSWALNSWNQVPDGYHNSWTNESGGFEAAIDHNLEEVYDLFVNISDPTGGGPMPLYGTTLDQEEILTQESFDM